MARKQFHRNLGAKGYYGLIYEADRVFASKTTSVVSSGVIGRVPTKGWLRLAGDPLGYSVTLLRDALNTSQDTKSIAAVNLPNITC